MRRVAGCSRLTAGLAGLEGPQSKDFELSAITACDGIKVEAPRAGPSFCLAYDSASSVTCSCDESGVLLITGARVTCPRRENDQINCKRGCIVA